MTKRSDPKHGFDHIPYGAFDPGDGTSRLGARMGGSVIDLRAAAQAGMVPGIFDAPNLDRLLAEPLDIRRAARSAVIDVVKSGSVDSFIQPIDSVQMVLPFTVGDFVDFYSSEAHATKVGSIFRPDGLSLPANWKHLPAGYHGRSGTVVVSGSDVVRPRGQHLRDADVVFEPSKNLDFEIEMAWVVAGITPSGRGPTIDDAESRIFGFTPLNDWSARDIQAWEYVPLGPFLSKSFASSIGPWVTPIEALADYRVSPPHQTPEPFDYLLTPNQWSFDIEFSVYLSTLEMRQAAIAPYRLSTVNYRDMYWTPAQQFAHMTVNGASARPGDVGGSGTISGWGPNEAGSLLELTNGGTAPIELPDGTVRTYLLDGDQVEIWAGTPDGKVSLGSVIGTIVA